MKHFKIFLYLLLLISPLFLINPQRGSAQSCETPPPGVPALGDGLISSKTLGNTTYITSSGKCLTGNSASIFLEQAKTKFDSYANLKILFYDQSKFPTKATSLPSPLIFSGSSLYYISSDLNIASNPTGNGVIVIFVDGDLTISNNISYADTDSESGLVFIVQGDIYIESTVTQVNAALISEGDICTTSVSGVCPTGAYQQAQQLTINGNLISINPDISDSHIKFVRTLSDNSIGAAEIINVQPKYLVILKDILATDLTVISEK